MVQLKTSTKISIKFTIFNLIILVFFGVVINLILCFSWYSGVMYQLENYPSIAPKKYSKLQTVYKDNAVINVPSDSPDALEIKNRSIWGNISIVGEDFIMYSEDDTGFKFLFINSQIQFQTSLINTTVILIMVSLFVSYLISIIFVKYSLKNLNKLVIYTKELDLENLDKPIDIPGRHDDEIKIVADTLNTALGRVNKQTLSLKDFISNVSHELKTPLMTMSSEVDLALKSGNYQKGLTKIKKNIKNLNELLEDLILITRLEKNIKIDKVMTDISQITIEKIDDISKNYEEKNIVLVKDIGEEIEISLNKSGFEIILKNLLENAFKYTNPNGEIRITLTQDYLEVKDNGIGIDSENLEKIFERFRQEDRARTHLNSFGLGLFLVKKLCDLQGFRIKVDSQKNIGTTFKILFNC